MYALVQTARHASYQEAQADLGGYMTQGNTISDQTARHMAKRWADTDLHGAVGSLIALASNQSFDTDELREEIDTHVQDSDEADAMRDWLDNLEATLSTD